ncbi:phage tail tape measure protein [Bacteroides pyogenes]|uniref:Phage tail tape measure protein n=1 Tax=Bacteroides pyogenes TaxID=310300 RepID=A0A5D3EIC2_9BACE|nr:phage tail tape measure protein [Bacteroides pyogenes]TYK35598.1 phage tail tape measure protein [Bacteroides pyogenes]
MGIVNRDGALYMATGIDNTGLYRGRQEAVGIIKAMAGEITSFDVFGGLGISAGIAFAKAASGAYEFEKQFESSMKEVATISDLVRDSMEDTKNKIISLTTDERIPVGANDMAKALYQIVSAGHDGADGMHILEVSAKSAVGGLTETATAADAITTILNAYKKDTSEAERVSDMLFTTAKLGKTTFGEMGKSISQVVPIAASFGIEMDQVLAAVATLTKSGVPTTQAMTQIRAAIIGASKQLGDGAFEAMTFQEALQSIADRANGSESALRAMMPEVEGFNGLLGLTGINAKAAASDLESMGKSVGATEKAFEEMSDSAENQMKLLGNNITKMLRPIGKGILEEVSHVSTAINKAFENGDMKKTLQNLGDLVVIVTGAFVGYKGAIIATTSAKRAHIVVTSLLSRARALEASSLVLSKGLHASEAAMVAKNMSARLLLTKALKAQTAAYLKNTAAMLTNPYVLAAAAVSALGYGLYKYATRLSSAEIAQRKFNDALSGQKVQADELKSKVQNLLTVVNDEANAEAEKFRAVKQLQEIMPTVFRNIDLETLKKTELLGVEKKVNEEIERRNRIGAKTKLVMANQHLQKINNGIIEAKKGGGYNLGMENMRKEAEEEVRLWEKQVKIYEDARKKITGSGEEDERKSELKNKAHWEKMKKDAEDSLAAMDVSQKGSKGWNKLVNEIAKYQKEIDKYDVSKSVKQGIEISKGEEKYKSILIEQMKERERLAEDLQMQIDESRISAMKEGSGKTLAQMELAFEKEMQAIDRQKEDVLRKKVDDARTAFEADPKNKNRVFDSSGIVLSDDEIKLFDEKYKAAIAIWEKNLSDYNQNSKKSWNEYLKEFGNYQQKRQAILDLAMEDAEKVSTPGERASILKKAQNEVDELDNSIRNSTTLMGQLFADASQKSASEIQKVIEKAELLMQYLEAVKDEEGSALIGGKKVSKQDVLDIGISDNTLHNLMQSTEQVESLRNAINKLKDDLGNKSPFELFKTQIKSASKKIKQGGKNSIAQGVSEIGGAMMQFSPAVSQFGKDLGNIVGDDDLGDKIAGITDAIGGLGQTAMGVGQIMSGDIVGGAMSAISGISQVVDALDGLFGADYSRYNAMKEQYDTLNSIWDELIEKKRKYIETSYGVEAVKVSEEAKRLQEKSIESQRILGRELLNSGASTGSHSIGIRIWKKMNAEAWKQAREALGTDWRHWYGDKSRMEWLFDLSAEQLSKLKEADLFWAKLNEETREYLNNIINGNEKLRDIDEQMKNQLTHTTFDSMYDNFIDKLMDMKSSTGDFIDDINAMFMRAFLANEIGAKYRERLRKWYDGFADDLRDGKLSDDEIKRKREDYQRLVEEAIRERDSIANLTGYAKENEEKGVTGKIQEALTEGTGNQIVGLGNMMALDIRYLRELAPEHFKCCDDIRMDVAQIMLIAEEIKNNTYRTANNTDGLKDELKGIREEISEVKKNTKGYTGRG